MVGNPNAWVTCLPKKSTKLGTPLHSRTRMACSGTHTGMVQQVAGRKCAMQLHVGINIVTVHRQHQHCSASIQQQQQQRRQKQGDVTHKITVVDENVNR